MNNLSPIDLAYLRETAERAAWSAGDYVQGQVGQGHAAEHKPGAQSRAAQVVTEVDRRAQAIILGHLAEPTLQYGLGLLTEESADDQSRLTQSHFWCVDPLDGTLAFTEGRPGYAVSIALVSQAGDPVVGVVYVPDEQLTYSAVAGQGVQRNGQPFVRPAAQEVADLQVYMDGSFVQAPYYEAVKGRLAAWVTSSGMPPSPGPAGRLSHPSPPVAKDPATGWTRSHRGGGPEGPLVHYHLGYGAVRNALAVLESPLGCYFKYPKPQPGAGSLWDYAATRLFFEELGLPVSDAQGQPLHLNRPETTFMHQVGVVYATEADLAEAIVAWGSEFGKI